jgi:hypothetical protein
MVATQDAAAPGEGVFVQFPRTRVLDKFSRVLGSQHPDIILLQKWQYI